MNAIHRRENGGLHRLHANVWSNACGIFDYITSFRDNSNDLHIVTCSGTLVFIVSYVAKHIFAFAYIGGCSGSRAVLVHAAPLGPHGHSRTLSLPSRRSMCSLRHTGCYMAISPEVNP